MIRSLVLTLAATVLVSAASARPAQAQVIDDRAYFTFSQPVAIPGRVLEPGRYMFRLADWDTGRKVVQVLNDDMTEVFGLIFTERVLRPTMPALPEVSLGEAPDGEPRSISIWWQPGDTAGRAFLYAPGEASWEREATTQRADD